MSWPGTSTSARTASSPDLLFCENDTNLARLYGTDATPPHPKDGINDHVVAGAPTVNPAQVGTKCAAWYRLTVGPGETQVVRVRLRPPSSSPAFGTPFDTVLAQRRSEADEFYAEVIPASVDEDARLVARQAFAGMIWGKQFYRYDVKRWLDGDPAQPPPPPERRRGRNAGWLNLDARDILSMPDPWEYPWFAAWDMAFHTIALAHLDPAFAKYQLLALCREWFQNPNGALPAYEWAFGDVNPPVHAWAALHVWDIDGRRDHDFLARLMPKLLMNFTWWVNQMDPEGDHLFAGGFLGLDNISVLDRSHLPPGGRLEQADGTSWMAFYSLSMLEIARVLAAKDDAWTDIEVKFIEHFVLIVDAMHTQGLWDEQDGFFYDVFHAAGGGEVPIRVRSIVGVLPLLGEVVLGPDLLELLGNLRKRFAGFLGYDELGVPAGAAGGWPPCPMATPWPSGSSRRERRAASSPGCSTRTSSSPPTDSARSRSTTRHTHCRSSSPGRWSRSTTSRRSPARGCSGATPTGADRCGCRSTTSWCEVSSATPGRSVRRPRSSTPLEAANRSCWRRRRRPPPAARVAVPRGPDGRRPCHGWVERLQEDPRWRDNVTFNEYFHGDNGAGLGASHQTGWTGLVADLICRPDPFAGDRRPWEL